jgi:5-methylthioadenosine/S-adenosylhomocysteine deaminase
MGSILIRGGTVVTMDPSHPVLEEGWVAIEGRHIAAVGAGAAGARPGSVTLEASGKIVMPGLVNCHLHTRPGRALGDGLALMDWHDRYADGFSARMTQEDSRVGALLAFGECLRAGVTSVLAMPILPAGCGRAAEAIGIRATIVPHAGDDPRNPGSLDSFEDNLALLRAQGDPAGHRVRYWLGFEHLLACTPGYLARVGGALETFPVGLHTHLNESRGELAATRQKFGELPVRCLERAGLLGPRTVLAHAVWLEPEEREILARTGTSVVHNPTSNMRLGNGIAPVADLLARGINVCLGTDGMLSAYKLDLFETMRAGAMLQRAATLDCRLLPAPHLLEMATLNGARALGLDAEIGSLAPGKKADLILLDAGGLHLAPRARGGHDNLTTLLVYAAHGSDVETVLVDGEIVVADRRLTRMDEAAVRRDAQAASDRILATIPPV